LAGLITRGDKKKAREGRLDKAAWTCRDKKKVKGWHKFESPINEKWKLDPREYYGKTIERGVRLRVTRETKREGNKGIPYKSYKGAGVLA